MTSFEDLAIVLKVIRFEERHQMITALTQHHGKITVMARNSVQSKRFGFSLQPFNASLWQLKQREGQDVFFLEGAELKKDFNKIRENYDAFVVAGILSEWVLRISPERQEAQDLFKMHSNVMTYLEELFEVHPFPSYEILCSYFLKSFVWLGIKPRLHQCIQCGSSVLDVEQAFAEIVRPGWRCQKCQLHSRGQQSVELSLDVLKSAVSFIDSPIRQTLERRVGEGSSFKAFFETIMAWVVYHVPGIEEHPLKSLSLLK